MDQSPLVSICIPTYNQESLVTVSILAALEQGYDNVEIIVIDDYSKDKTWDVVLKLQEKYPKKIKAFRNDQNLGITGNSNQLLSKISGDYVIFQGGDDQIAAGRIQKQINWFKDNPMAVVCASSAKVIDLKSKRILGIYQDKAIMQKRSIASFIRQRNQLSGSIFMYKRESCEGIIFDPRTPIVSDWLFWVETLSKGEYGGIDDVGVIYPRHEQSITSSGVHKIHLDDRLIGPDILFSKTNKNFFSLKIARSNVLYFAAKRHYLENDLKTTSRFFLYSLSEAPLFFSYAWLLLPLIIFRMIGIDLGKIFISVRKIYRNI